jgi:hypothetical protein
LNTLCFAGPTGILACFDSESCGGVITANITSLDPARAFGTDPCVPVCITRCTPDAAPPTGDASDSSVRPEAAPDAPAEATPDAPAEATPDATDDAAEATPD